MPNNEGVISSVVKNQAALPQIDRKDPDYAKKVSELAASIAAGNAPNAAASTEVPEKKVPRTSPSYQQTLFDEPDVDLPADVSSATTPPPSGKKVVKFTDDIGDEQEFEFDFTDEYLTDVAKRARRAENLEQEVAAMRDEMAGRSAALAADSEKVKRYLELEGKGTDAVIDELLRQEGGYEGLRNKIIEEYKGYAAMTVEEKHAYDLEKTKADSARRLAELEKRLSEKEKAAERKTADAGEAQRKAVLNTVFSKYKFENPENDKAITSINEMIFNEARTAIRALEAAKVTVTENILNREFKKAHAMFKGKVSATTSRKVDPVKTVADAMDAAAAAAQTLAATKTPPSGAESDSETISRWIGMIQKGQLPAVNQEAAKSAKGQGLFAKLANMISRDRNILTSRK